MYDLVAATERSVLASTFTWISAAAATSEFGLLVMVRFNVP